MCIVKSKQTKKKTLWEKNFKFVVDRVPSRRRRQGSSRDNFWYTAGPFLRRYMRARTKCSWCIHGQASELFKHGRPCLSQLRSSPWQLNMPRRHSYKDSHVAIHTSCCDDTSDFNLASIFLLRLSGSRCSILPVDCSRDLVWNTGSPPNAADEMSMHTI